MSIKANRCDRNYKNLVEFLLYKHCEDCGEDDIMVLEFDHVRGVKKRDVNEMVSRGMSWGTIEEEIAKCDVVCANCHRRRTAKRGNYRRWVHYKGLRGLL